jgi:hypothetical protein
VQEGERKREEEEKDMLVENIDKNCKLYLNIS